MDFFKKKNAATTDSQTDVASVTESLYRQNLELAVKNKTLSLLRQLYQISILALEPAALSERISNTVREALEFELVAIFISDKPYQKISPLSFSYSSRLKEYIEKSGVTLHCIVPDVMRNIFLQPIFSDKVQNHAYLFGELWSECVGKEKMSELATSAHVRTTSGYPLIIDGEVIGVLVLGMNREYESLSKYEQESISSLVDVVAIALDKARLYQELTESNKRQESLIHFISHEIKGYMTKSEAAFSGIFDGDYGEITAETRALTESALADTRKGVSTVMDILSASNLKKGTVAYVMKPFDLKSIINASLLEQRLSAEAKHLTLSVDIDDDNFTMTGDEAQIKDHVIGNLIDNAIKYTPNGTVTVFLKKKNNMIVFSVKDSGIGITEDDKKKLFTEGGRGAESIKTNVNSTGYGLYIAKQIVDAHKGRIWAESEGAGKGSTFFVELPA